LSAKREQFCAQPGLELFDKGVCSNVVLFAPAALSAGEGVRAPRTNGFAAAHGGKPLAYHQTLHF